MPAADIEVDEAMVRALIAQAGGMIPDAAVLPLRRVAEGWDNSLWRLGDTWAVRLPRRASAVRLTEHEQRWLPVLGPAVTAASGLAVPVVRVAGMPTADFPWPWSIVEWIAGVSGVSTSRGHRHGWARPLARALRALHRPSPTDRPENPYRGRPLSTRSDDVRDRLRRVRGVGRFGLSEWEAAERAWDSALAALPWEGPDLWLHGDLHPGNLIARGGDLVAMIDFGDLTGGDPAYDLAVAWLAFDERSRREFRDEYGRADPPTWTRARGWAAAVALLIAASDDRDPSMQRMASEALTEIATDLNR